MPEILTVRTNPLRRKKGALFVKMSINQEINQAVNNALQEDLKKDWNKVADIMRTRDGFPGVLVSNDGHYKIVCIPNDILVAVFNDEACSPQEIVDSFGDTWKMVK